VKPALGRSLGTLMGNGTQPQSGAEQPSAPGAGVRSLIKGTAPAPEAIPAAPVAPEPAATPAAAETVFPPKRSFPEVALPAWYLFAMDALLTAVAAGLMLAPGGPSWKIIAAQGALLALGCALAALGAVNFHKRR